MIFLGVGYTFMGPDDYYKIKPNLWITFFANGWNGIFGAFVLIPLIPEFI